ncbi:hypothetical protein BJF90_37555 [Pseudonocardia sp. CNS-004]|nr:hypothetical protein BJF90_37555 [Pseudonocardia sp. CNS-004]
MATVEVSTLIRRPPEEVFAAFVDPAITTRFWFTGSSGALAPGATVRWEWEMYGVSDTVLVKEFDHPDRLVLGWGSGSTAAGDEHRTTEFRFQQRDEGTVVTVTETGFAGSADEALAYVGGATGGYTTALCAAKALLEHGIELGAVRDKFPGCVGVMHPCDRAVQMA